jgi:hypothetical protein
VAGGDSGLFAPFEGTHVRTEPGRCQVCCLIVANWTLSAALHGLSFSPFTKTDLLAGLQTRLQLETQGKVLDITNRMRGSLQHKMGKSRWQRTACFRVQLCAMALLFLTGSTPIQPQSAPSVEYQVKAAFLSNFAKFVEWPADAFVSEKTPITLCVFRYDPFGSALDEVIRGKTINNRELTARRVNELPDLKSCQLVFVSDREDKALSEIFKSVNGASVLIVGESADFAERGGAVQFFLENNKLRFAVNVDAVQRARLQISSKLLALARIAHDSVHPRGK